MTTDHRAEADQGERVAQGAGDAEGAAGGRVWVERSLLKAIVDARPCAVSDPDECSLCELRAALATTNQQEVDQ